VISPAILVLALKGFEETIKSVTSRKDKVNVIAYADDFVITGATKAVLENKIMPVVVAFLKERGLELSTEKTKITHIDDGFNFLGFNIRKYKGKLLIKPSKENLKIFLNKIRDFIKSNPTMKTENLIRHLNPKIRGWANYYRHVVAKATFNYVDNRIFRTLMRWIRRRHPEKNAQWRNKKYFRTQGIRRWIFSVKVKNKKGNYSFLDLFTASKLPIRRHVKVRAEANPYDPRYVEYFCERERLKSKRRIQDQALLNPKLKDLHTNHWTAGSCKHGL